MPEVQGEKSIASGGAGTHEMQRVINGSAGQIFRHGEHHRVLIFPRSERDKREVVQYGVLDETLNVVRKQPGLQGQCGERRKKFGQTVGCQVPLNRSVMDSLQPGKGDGMVRMLLK